MYLIDSHWLKFKLVQFVAFFDLSNAGMIFIFLDSLFYWVLIPFVPDSRDWSSEIPRLPVIFAK